MNPVQLRDLWGEYLANYPKGKFAGWGEWSMVKHKEPIAQYEQWKRSQQETTATQTAK